MNLIEESLPWIPNELRILHTGICVVDFDMSGTQREDFLLDGGQAEVLMCKNVCFHVFSRSVRRSDYN